MPNLAMKEFAEYAADQMGGAGNVGLRLMFGAYCVYLDGKPIGIAGEGRLFLKKTRAGLSILPDARLEPPYEGAKEHILLESEVDDRELMERLAKATACEIPAKSCGGKKR